MLHLRFIFLWLILFVCSFLLIIISFLNYKEELQKKAPSPEPKSDALFK